MGPCFAQHPKGTFPFPLRALHPGILLPLCQVQQHRSSSPVPPAPRANRLVPSLRPPWGWALVASRLVALSGGGAQTTWVCVPVLNSRWHEPGSAPICRPETTVMVTPCTKQLGRGQEGRSTPVTGAGQKHISTWK